MIKVESLSIGYGKSPLLKDISFELPDGSCVLLAGPNGSGKSTFLRTLAGLQTALRGTVSATEIILVPTGIPKVKGFTVLDFVGTAFYKQSRWSLRMDRSASGYISRALLMLDMQNSASRDISTLSDGEFQKACIATAVARSLAGPGSGVLLLDEPTAFLDVDSRSSLIKLLISLAHEHGTTVIFSSHDILDALPYVDRVMAVTQSHELIVSDPAPLVPPASVVPDEHRSPAGTEESIDPGRATEPIGPAGGTVRSSLEAKQYVISRAFSSYLPE